MTKLCVPIHPNPPQATSSHLFAGPFARLAGPPCVPGQTHRPNSWTASMRSLYILVGTCSLYILIGTVCNGNCFIKTWKKTYIYINIHTHIYIHTRANRDYSICVLGEHPNKGSEPLTKGTGPCSGTTPMTHTISGRLPHVPPRNGVPVTNGRKHGETGGFTPI